MGGSTPYISLGILGFYIALGILGFVLLMVVLVKAANAASQQYREEVTAWAAAQGWSYREGGGGPWTQLLSQGDQRGVKLQMEGSKRDRRVTVAHYWYQNSSSKSTTTHDLMVFVVHLQSVYPAISVQTRGLGSRIARSFGRQDPNSVGEESFDHVFRVRTEDSGFSRSVVTPNLVQAHLTGTVPLWSLRDNELVTTWDGKIRVELIHNRLDQLLHIADLLGTI